MVKIAKKKKKLKQKVPQEKKLSGGSPRKEIETGGSPSIKKLIRQKSSPCPAPQMITKIELITIEGKRV